MKPKPIIIVQGAQWGSEAKGMVAAALCLHRDVRYAVRTGAVNAGHTVYYRGHKYVNQQLPTGWVNPNTVLVLGPGAYINPEILFKEIDMVRNATGLPVKLMIDYRAGLHLPEHTDRAAASGRHYSIGATGKGCSEAIIDRIRLRGSGGMLFADWYNHEPAVPNVMMGDTTTLLNQAYDNGEQILLEGTQGTLLDLYLGPYPFTTHKQCTASQWVTEAGLSPSLEYEVVLVTRTYPIRVAGNSGPMPGEIDWVTLAMMINEKLLAAKKSLLLDPMALYLFMEEYEKHPDEGYSSMDIAASERNRDTMRALPPAVVKELGKLFEFTTVTKKLRRVARLDMPSLKESVMLNRPSWIALTFLNYEFPQLWGVEDPIVVKGMIEYVDHIEKVTGITVGAITTGPEHKHFCSLQNFNHDTR